MKEKKLANRKIKCKRKFRKGMLKLVARGIGSGMQGKKRCGWEWNFAEPWRYGWKALTGYGKRNKFAGKRYKDV